MLIFHVKPLVQGDVGLSVKKREFHALYRDYVKNRYLSDLFRQDFQAAFFQGIGANPLFASQYTPTLCNFLKEQHFMPKTAIPLLYQVFISISCLKQHFMLNTPFTLKQIMQYRI